MPHSKVPALALAVLLCPLLVRAKPLAAPQTRFIILCRPDLPHSLCRNNVRDFVVERGGRVYHDLPLVDAVAVWLPEAAAKELNTLTDSVPEALKVSPDPIPKVSLDRGSDFLDKHPAVRHKVVRWNLRLSRTSEAWDYSAGRGVKICVIDTGINARHPDLKANVKGGINTLAPDGSRRSRDFSDDQDHGTGVAGVIAAAGPNDRVSTIGMAPEASLYAVKAVKPGVSRVSDYVAGFQWCVKKGIPLINASFSFDRDHPLIHLAVQKAYRNGSCIITSAGNTGGPLKPPASYKETIAVSAAEIAHGGKGDLIFADFSNRGPEVDFIAPGVRIHVPSAQGGSHLRSGTSVAAPHVTGAAALILAQSGPMRPHALYRELMTAAFKLKIGSEDIPETFQGNGMIDALWLFRQDDKRPEDWGNR